MTAEIEVGLIPRGRKTYSQIDYSALDRDTIEQALIDYVIANFPQQQDVTQATGFIIVTRMIAYVADLLSYRADYLANNNYLTTCTNKRALDNLLSLIGYRRSGVQAAVTDIAIVPQNTVGDVTDLVNSLTIHVPARTTVSGTGAQGQPVTFELFASSTNIFDDIVVPTGASSVVAYAIEGTSKSTSVSATGNRFMQITLPDLNVLADSIRINIGVYDPTDPNAGTTYNPNLPQWEEVDYVVLHGAENVYETKLGNDGLISIIFGDGTFGNIPPAGQTVIINYRVGGGNNGNVPASNLNGNGSYPIYNGGIANGTTMKCTLTNISRAAGGADEESIEQAKFLAPLVFQAQQRAVKDIDYTALALANTKVAKCVAVSRQDIIIDSYQDSTVYNFPLAATQSYTLAFTIHRLDSRTAVPYQANLTMPATSYTSIDTLILDLNAQLGWTYDQNSLSFRETSTGSGFVAHFDKSVEGFLELWIHTGDYQARVTLNASGNSVLPMVNIPMGTYGRVDANYVDLHILAYAEDGNVTVPNAALVNELRSYFDKYKEINTQVTVRRGFIELVDITGNVFIDKTADPIQVQNLINAAIGKLFTAGNMDLGQALPVSQIIFAIESVEGVAYVDQLVPAQNLFAAPTTLLQLGTVNITLYEAKQ